MSMEDTSTSMYVEICKNPLKTKGNLQRNTRNQQRDVRIHMYKLLQVSTYMQRYVRTYVYICKTLKQLGEHICQYVRNVPK